MTMMQAYSRWLLATMLFLFLAEAVAGRPPPGVPRRNQCNNSLTAVKVQDLSFGDYEGTIGGTITVSATGTRSSVGPNLAGGVVTAAAFDVSNSLSGCNYYPVRIRLPGNTTLSGPATMTVDSFTSDPLSLFSLSPVPGMPTRVNVGARLTSNNNQAGGTYTTATPYQVRFDHRNP